MKPRYPLQIWGGINGGVGRGEICGKNARVHSAWCTDINVVHSGNGYHKTLKSLPSNPRDFVIQASSHPSISTK